MDENKLLQKITKISRDSTIRFDKITYQERLILAEFYHDEILTMNKSREYMLSPFFNNYNGLVVTLKPKFAFVKIEENEEEVYVDIKYLNGAMVNDKVKIWVFPKSGRGYIEQILERGNKEVVGKISYRNKPHIIPSNKEITDDIYLQEGSLIGSPNDIVVVEITSFGNPLMGIIKETLGNINTPGVDILAKVYEHHIPYKFSDETLKQVDNVPVSLQIDDDILSNRLDLRDELIVTIDGEDAKDFDDAINVKITEKGYQLGVHIADVTHYVRENSPLDKDALLRGTSIYLADRVIPMLPFKLSNGICSLNPNEDRLTLSCIMDIDHNGKVTSYEITPSIINSKYRLTYKQVNGLFANEEKLSPEISEMLFLAKILAAKIRKERESRGSIDLNIDEPKLIVNEEGKVTDILKREHGISERLIEDFMIVANESVASYIYYLDMPFIYRVHEEPAKKKLQQLIPMLKGFGISLNAKNGIHPSEMQNIIHKTQNSPTHDVISQLILRSLAKAKYSEENVGHFGLGSDCYTHFTSPIRRYPDLLVHRLVKEYQKNMLDVNHPAMLSKIADIAKSTSASERKAVELEREVTSMKMAQYMLDHIGEEYDGIVSGIIDSGFFIILDNLVEGMVKFERVEYDYFHFDAKKMEAIGRGSKKIIRLGQRFKVKVISSNPQTGKIEFELVDTYGLMNLPKKDKVMGKKRH